MMKNLKKGLFGTTLAAVMLFLMPFMVNAASSITNETMGDTYGTITEAINAASSGDVIKLPDGTYAGDITIDKAITLKGSSKDGTVIKGQINVSSGNKDVNIDSLTISNKGMDTAGIKVTGKSKITVKNAVIEYTGYTDSNYGNSDFFTGIWLTKTADSSTLTVKNTDIYAKYGIWVYGQGNSVTVQNSKITGWAPMDISNGSSATTLATNNTVNISGSTLTGVATLTGDTNGYATIVIGGQDGLELNIANSTIQNKFMAVNVQDLITYGDAYLPSENVIVGIEGSKLINNDTTNNSAIYTFGKKEAADPVNGNFLFLADTKMTSTNGKTIEVPSDYVTVTLIAQNEEAVFTVEKGSVFTDKPEDPNIEGYTFGGWYTDDTYTNEFDFTKEINQNTKIYAKFQANKTGEVVKPSDVKNPETNDNIILYVIVSLLGALAIVVSYKKFKKIN
ncbi:MAG: InlB B-repeat-containing protein [Bacilli bacterium]|jgi:hypothetical protein